MATWWVRKSSKNKKHLQEEKQEKGGKSQKLKSFDDAFRNSPRASTNFTPTAACGSSSGLSCWDSDGGDKRGLPLPLPSIQTFSNDQCLAFGSASVSGSSISSTASYDDLPTFHSLINTTSESGQLCSIQKVRFVCDDQTSKKRLKQLNKPVVNLHSNRTTQDGDCATKPVFAALRAVTSPRKNTRMVKSLPISPCLTPL